MTLSLVWQLGQVRMLTLTPVGVTVTSAAASSHAMNATCRISHTCRNFGVWDSSRNAVYPPGLDWDAGSNCGNPSTPQTVAVTVQTFQEALGAKSAFAASDGSDLQLVANKPFVFDVIMLASTVSTATRPSHTAVDVTTTTASDSWDVSDIPADAVAPLSQAEPARTSEPQAGVPNVRLTYTLPDKATFQSVTTTGQHDESNPHSGMWKKQGQIGYVGYRRLMHGLCTLSNASCTVSGPSIA